MSSFVVDKVEYMKAAGIMYGVEESDKFPNRYFLDRVRKIFTEIYGLNVDSVNEQYEVNQAKDEEEYDETFEKYREVGRLWRSTNKEKRIELRNKMLMFFESVLYQIENTEMSKTASSYFFTCAVRLMPEIYDTEGCWGSLDV